MEVGKDEIGGDFYCQCRNKNCEFDGWFADTLKKLKEVYPK